MLGIEEISVPEGRINAASALHALGKLGFDEEVLLTEIPELHRYDLGFGVTDVAANYDRTHPVGEANAAASKGYFYLRVPAMNVEGIEQDMTTVRNRSYLLHILEGTIQGFPEFDDAQMWLLDNVATATISDYELTLLGRAPGAFPDDNPA